MLRRLARWCPARQHAIAWLAVVSLLVGLNTQLTTPRAGPRPFAPASGQPVPVQEEERTETPVALGSCQRLGSRAHKPTELVPPVCRRPGPHAAAADRTPHSTRPPAHAAAGVNRPLRC